MAQRKKRARARRRKSSAIGKARKHCGEKDSQARKKTSSQSEN
jgi:hypothetical protein